MRKILEECYGTLMLELGELLDALVKHDAGRVVMESTSICWMPVRNQSKDMLSGV